MSLITGQLEVNALYSMLSLHDVVSNSSKKEKNMSFFMTHYPFVMRKNRKSRLLEEKTKQKTHGFGIIFQSHTSFARKAWFSLLTKQFLDATQ
jgi:hypothetical protein